MASNSILHCFNSTGEFQLDAYIKQRNIRRAAAVDEIVDQCLRMAEEEAASDSVRRRRRDSKDRRGHIPKKRDSCGNLVPIDPQDTMWWTWYIASPPLNNKRFAAKFRRRFRRMPYQQYLELCEDIRVHPLFVKWTRLDAAKRDSSPIELLLSSIWKASSSD